MNRREFISGLFAAGALTALKPNKAIEQFLVETASMNDAEFVAYVSYIMNLWVNNPSQYAIITNIEDYEN